MMGNVGTPVAVWIKGVGTLPFSGDGEPTFKKGGVEITVDMFGDHSANYVGIVKPWELSDCTLKCDFSNGQDKLLEDSQIGDETEIGVSFAHGLEYVMMGKIIGEVECNHAKGTVSISLGGGGKVKKL